MICCLVYKKNNKSNYDNLSQNHVQVSFLHNLDINIASKKYTTPVTYDEICENSAFWENEIQEKLEICFDQNCNNPRCKNVIIVHSNYKTASTTLYSSLCLFLSSYYRIFHFHNDTDLENVGLKHISIPQLVSFLQNKHKNVTIIENYRPIFDIVVSVFFMFFPRFCKPLQSLDSFCEYMNYVINTFNKLFLVLYKIFDVDFLSEVYLSCNSSNLLKLKVKDSSKTWDQIIQDRFHCSDYFTISENQTENKKVGNIYQEFKSIYKMPNNIFQLIKNNKSFLKYYSEDEQSEYLLQWEKKGIVEDVIYFHENNVLNLLNDTKINNPEENNKMIASINQENTSKRNNCNCDSCIERNEAEVQMLLYLKETQCDINDFKSFDEENGIEDEDYEKILENVIFEESFESF